MGRTRPKSKGIRKPESPTKAPPSIPSLMEKAQELIVQCDYELALRFIRRILEQQNDNVEAKEMLGVCLLETGELESAKQAFQSLIESSSSSLPPPSAHLYLAQLSDDDPQIALRHYQAAVEILMNQLKGKQSQSESQSENNTSDETDIKNNIVRALIGQVEIWMDPSYDLCFDPNAEKTCEDLLSLALQTMPSNIEALQSLASVRMSQQRPEEAKQILEQIWSSISHLSLDDPLLPPTPTRLLLAKLFLELGLFSPALLVLQGVIAVDDQEVEAWYLEGWCFFLMCEQVREEGNGNGNVDGKLEDLSWEELAKDARDCLETCQVLHVNQDHPDKPLLEHTKELISKLEALGIHPSPLDDDDEGGEGEDWEDAVSDDDDVEMQ